MRQQEQQQRRLTQNGCVDMCQGTPVDPEQYGMPEAASFGQQENVDRTAGHDLCQPTNHPNKHTKNRGRHSLFMGVACGPLPVHPAGCPPVDVATNATITNRGTGTVPT